VRVTRAVKTPTLELQTVLSTIVAKARAASGTEAGAIYVLDPSTENFSCGRRHGMSDELIADLDHQGIGLGGRRWRKWRRDALHTACRPEGRRASAGAEHLCGAGYDAARRPTDWSPGIIGCRWCGERRPASFRSNTVACC